ncbi:uncharacterized protein B0P05DRAFT_532635 [Gilbertella persicaria]|uniref:uncharacterized protein n=1 Tax=Gilbertella persicaria TaxID=101096 RepID=UPI002221284F|nr:uncharacterized protein B0P05DRAFT_532635 [Gilbertella persicaria]KAI8086851.1 hypothetical protein B0P05DRAFT_532635 [Gilbertella persicaria]
MAHPYSFYHFQHPQQQFIPLFQSQQQFIPGSQPPSDQPFHSPPYQPQPHEQFYHQPQQMNPEVIQAIYETFLYQQQQQEEEEYYRQRYRHPAIPKRKRSKPRRSRSTRSLNSRYLNEYYQEEDQYYPGEADTYYHTGKKHEPQGQHYNNDTWRLKVDGEPMNELEKLAAENASINERASKAYYPQDMSAHDIAPQAPPQVPAPTSSSDPSIDMANIIHSLTVDDGSPCITSDQTSSLENNVAIVQQQKKKKSWLFRFFYNKKPTPNYFLATMQQSNSIPPTPTLTPDNGSTSSPTSSFYLIDPSLLEEGVWAFQLPESATKSEEDRQWYSFEEPNQKIIRKYIHRFNSPKGINCSFQLFDKGICGGNLPVLVTPFYKKCYFARDTSLSEMVTMDINLFQNV